MWELCEIVLVPQTQANKSFTFQYKAKDLSFSYSQEARTRNPRNRRKKNTLPTQEDPNEEDEQDDHECLPEHEEGSKVFPGTPSPISNSNSH